MRTQHEKSVVRKSTEQEFLEEIVNTPRPVHFRASTWGCSQRDGARTMRKPPFAVLTLALCLAATIFAILTAGALTAFARNERAITILFVLGLLAATSLLRCHECSKFNAGLSDTRRKCVGYGVLVVLTCILMSTLSTTCPSTEPFVSSGNFTRAVHPAVNLSPVTPKVTPQLPARVQHNSAQLQQQLTPQKTTANAHVRAQTPPVDDKPSRPTNWTRTPESTVVPGTQFFGLWFTDQVTPAPAVPLNHVLQLSLWARSIIYHHPTAQVHLFVQIGTVSPTDLHLRSIAGLNVIPISHVSELLAGTPAARPFVPRGSPAEVSDLVRLAVLYKWGGTWIDIDDILIGPVRSQPNVIGTALFPKSRTNCSFMICRFSRAQLIPLELVGETQETRGGAHVQNDPMLNWQPGNVFLREWIRAITTTRSVPVLPRDWGQTIPTDLIRTHPTFVTGKHVTLWPQHTMLLHPAYASWDGRKKGPLFPPYDRRVRLNFPKYDTTLTELEFWAAAEEVLRVHSFFAIKNSKRVGIAQCQTNASKRWFVGWVSACANDHRDFGAILGRLKTLSVPAAVGFKFSIPTQGALIGSPRRGRWRVIPGTRLPWDAYNPSVATIRRDTWIALCTSMGMTSTACSLTEPAVVAISWFVKVPKGEYGCANWIGFASMERLTEALAGKPPTAGHASLWVDGGMPRLLRNVLGPKLADPRLFTARTLASSRQPRLFLVGYARLAPSSRVARDMPDYFVRTAAVVGRPSESGSCNGTKPSGCDDFNVESSVGCFPVTLECCTPLFEGDVGNGQLSLGCPENGGCTSLVHPHVSRHPSMPSTVRLNGVSVSFTLNSSNEDAATRIAAKNIVPVVCDSHDCGLPSGLAAFVDFSPLLLNGEVASAPLVSIANLETGRPLAVRPIAQWGGNDTCTPVLKKKWRGSTQVVSLGATGGAFSASPLFVAVLHRRTEYLYNHAVVLLRSERVELAGNRTAQLPLTCVGVLKGDPLASLGDRGGFAFATGLAPLSANSSHGGGRFVLSAGLSDAASFFTEMRVLPA